MKKLLQPILILAAALPLAGWDYPLSDDALAEIDWQVDYREVKAHPQKHEGRTLLLGGRIVDHAAEREGSRLEILCYRLDKRDRPEEADPDCGRFLATTARVLDPERYSKGRLVTLTGVVEGEKTLPLGDETYTYPLFRIGEVHLWPRPPEHPRYYYRDPFYDPFYDPFCDPWRPHRRYGIHGSYRCW